MKLWLIALALLASAAAQEISTASFITGIAGPTDIQNAADGSGRLFLVQQSGIIRIVKNGALLPTPFLNISTKTHADGERGLLGLAFPPGFAQKQRFYVDYTDLNGNTVIAMYRVTSNADVADPSSEVALLNITQPYANHNGGQVRFGPDGYLYIGMGDGGSGGDPQNHAQNRNDLLGKILRVDVETEPGHLRIPPTNPFTNATGARPEIWAIGMRNPWRFSFDRATGDLWIADVGQDSYEEVDFQPASSKGGENYGWNSMEGMHCYKAGCSPQGLVLPVAEYSHSLGCSIAGGFVYRGLQYPNLRGSYLYGDYCSGRIWAVKPNGATWASPLLLESGFGITTFGEDEAGELYVANAGNGTIYRIQGVRTPFVVNAASFEAGLTPGSLATAFTSGLLADQGITGASQIPLPLNLAGVSVSVNGIPAPLLAVANVSGVEQVNFQAPVELTGTTATITVARAGQSSTSAAVPIVAAQPAIYGSAGARAVVVHNATYALVTADNPLTAGEYAFLYAAGLSASQAPASGRAAPASQLVQANGTVTVSLGSQPCDVQFAGLAPGFVGVYQVNFRVPAGLTAGQQTLTLRNAGITSPPLLAPVM